MKLKDAIFEMKCGDIFDPDDKWFVTLGIKKNGAIERVEDGTEISLSKTNLEIEGEIIPNDSHVLTRDEIFKRLEKYEPIFKKIEDHEPPFGQLYTKNAVGYVIELCRENFRLERDIEYKEMRAYVEMMRGDSNSYRHDAAKVLEDLTPL